jgi:hypothetical protein
MGSEGYAALEARLGPFLVRPLRSLAVIESEYALKGDGNAQRLEKAGAAQTEAQTEAQTGAET